jgi:hypothetical protein
MGVERRRAGFRLPWVADGEDASETEAAVLDGTDEPTPADADTPTIETQMTADSTDDSATPEAPEPMTAAAPAPAADPEAPAAATAEADDFLKSLVGAMRGVAETSRDSSLSELRTAIDERIETLTSEASQRETDIRRQADVELEAVGEWERTEIDRVKADAEAKRNDRRAALEQQLADHRVASEREIEATRARLAQHENELAAFFSQLHEITDPAAFVAAAKRMPRAPELGASTATPAAATPTEATAVPDAANSPDAAADLRLAALGMTPEAPAADDTAAATAAPTQSGDAAAEATSETSEPEAEAMASTNGTAPAGDAQLAERLAQLDERLSGAEQPAATAAPASPPASTETSTPIVVKGLGSFGAITSFKQSLERVEGIRGVTLSLGPTGEFVYRASHAAGFDLVAAIQALEGPTASIENTDGTLVVSLSRAR